MLTFLIQAVLNTLAVMGGFISLLNIILMITKDNLEILPKHYLMFLMWIFMAVLAIKGLILAYDAT